MEDEPLVVSIAGYEVLAYEGPDGIRVAAWKHPKRVESGVVHEYEIEDPGQEIAARRFPTIHGLENAVRWTLRRR